MRNVVAPRLAAAACAARGAAAAAALALAAAIAPPAAQAADDPCPNAALRAQQGASHLPDCRAYELVSPPNKNGNAVSGVWAVHPSGDRIAYVAIGAFPGSLSSLTADFVAHRGADGWTTTAVNPPTLYRNATANDQWWPADVADDFRRVLLKTTYPVDPRDDERTDDVYLSDGTTFPWISTGEPPRPSADGADYKAATRDLGRILLQTRRPLLPEVEAEAPGTTQLYLNEGGRVRLVSADDDGRPIAGGASFGNGADTTGSRTVVGGLERTAFAADGDVVFFKRDRDNQVYVRVNALDPAAARTRLLSVSQATGTEGTTCPTTATTRFLAAAADGSSAVFSCAMRLTDDAPANGGLYRYDVASGRLTAIAATAGAALNNTNWIASAEDLSVLYFVTNARLVGQAESGSHLYALRDGRIDWLGQVGTTAPSAYNFVASPDGRYLLFQARMGTDPIANGRTQVYLYDADSGERPRCVSCRPDGRLSQGDGQLDQKISIGMGNDYGSLSNVRMTGALSTGARRVFFTSHEPLVPEDVNGMPDPYLLQDGRLYLLTSGRDPAPSAFAGASSDGDTAFIVTNERLAAQDTDNGVADVYAVRVGGGYPAPAPTPECEHDCQGPPHVPPTVPEPGTIDFVGPGDVDEQAQPRTAAVMSVAGLSARQRRTWATRGRVTLRVRVSRAGTVRATVRGRIGRRWVRVAQAARTAREGGTVRVPLTLSRAARRHLRRHGALPLRIAVRYSAGGGAQQARLTLRWPARHQGGRR